MLPHAFPFRFAETVHEGRVAVSLSADAHWGRDGHPYPGTLAVEILAQAAILLLPGPESGDGGTAKAGQEGEALLAGIDGAEIRAPLLPGERLWARLELDRRLGRLVKARGTLERDSGEEVARAGLLLAVGG